MPPTTSDAATFACWATRHLTAAGRPDLITAATAVIAGTATDEQRAALTSVGTMSDPCGIDLRYWVDDNDDSPETAARYAAWAATLTAREDLPRRISGAIDGCGGREIDARLVWGSVIRAMEVHTLRASMAQV